MDATYVNLQKTAIDNVNKALNTSMSHFFTVLPKMTIEETETPLLAAAQQEFERQKKIYMYQENIMAKIRELEETKEGEEEEEEETTPESEESVSDSDDSCPELEEVSEENGGTPLSFESKNYYRIETVPKLYNLNNRVSCAISLVALALETNSTTHSSDEGTRVVPTRATSHISLIPIESIEASKSAKIVQDNNVPDDPKGEPTEKKDVSSNTVSSPPHSDYAWEAWGYEEMEQMARKDSDVIAERPSSPIHGGNVDKVDMPKNGYDVIAESPDFQSYAEKGKIRIEMNSEGFGEKMKMYTSDDKGGWAEIEISHNKEGKSSVFIKGEAKEKTSISVASKNCTGSFSFKHTVSPGMPYSFSFEMY